MYWLKIELPKLSSHSQVATQPSKVMPWLTGIWLDPWLNLAITSGLPQNLPILILNSFNTTEHTSTFWTLKSFLKSLCQTANFIELRGPFTWCATFWTSQWITGCNMEPLCLEKRTEQPHEWNDILVNVIIGSKIQYTSYDVMKHHQPSAYYLFVKRHTDIDWLCIVVQLPVTCISTYSYNH